MANEPSGKAKGGAARAAALSPERRKEIAKKAIEARWAKNLPRATHEGPVRIGEAIIPAANLSDGRRVLSQGQFLRAIGRSSTPKAGTGVQSTLDELPSFLQAKALEPFISNELRDSTKPIFYLDMSGNRAVGYDALMLPLVCNVYLDFRTSELVTNKKVPTRYAHIIEACDMLSRGLQRLGIIGLVDEATGFQASRDREALQEMLDRFLRHELAAWAKRFPDEFYEHIFRLRGWKWHGRSKNPPQVVAAYTKDIVYARLAPQILDELEKRNPIEGGRRKGAHHQLLTEDVGHPALAQHLHAVVTLMRVSKTWSQFKLMLDIAHPKRGDTLQLPLMAETTVAHEPDPEPVPSPQADLFGHPK
ncbi:P63C domain-containing protein [Bradyrhizobium macuxiense]|uniref:P63C domain-containing protein n=1 Tax=Bradyrhizobium macuxiense TaxID=1755647 RepID=A0A560LZ05_9BRAD|nr:P63C domain-containing protein [Bradyrhizobium macuxiense]TWC00450.1 P63C domain-containing protein [Bradyrhizobium macuxiense]